MDNFIISFMFCGLHSLRVSGARNFSRQIVTPARRGRRVQFNVPGSDERKLNKVKKLDLDVAVFDLEDGVAPNRKEEARKMITHHLQTVQDYPKHMEKSIRMNAVDSSLEHDDMRQCILPSLPFLDSVLIPKVEFPNQLRYVAWHIAKALQQTPRAEPFELIAAIESAKGILNLADLCNTELPPQVKLTGLVVSKFLFLQFSASNEISMHLKIFVLIWG